MENGIFSLFVKIKMLIRNDKAHNNITGRDSFYSLCIKGQTGNAKSKNKT